MISLDTTAIIDAFVAFVNYFVITIPQTFISAALDGGVLRDIWVSFFGNSDVINLAFLLSLLGGMILISRNNIRNRRSGRSRM